MNHYEEVTLQPRPVKPAPAHAAGKTQHPGLIDGLLAKFDAWAGIPERYEIEDNDPVVLM